MADTSTPIAAGDEPAPALLGTEWLADYYYSRFAPFAWTPWATGSTVVQGWASHVCTRMKGQKASRAPDASKGIGTLGGFETGAVRHAVDDLRPIVCAVTPNCRQRVAFDAATDE